MYKLYNGDCLKVMDKLIEEGIKVDCILCDPPYGTTACKWDTVIPFKDMWERITVSHLQAVVPYGGSVSIQSTLIPSSINLSITSKQSPLYNLYIIIT